MTFIEFQKPVKAHSKIPRITIRPSGSISFNAASAKIIKKEGEGFLIFMFDRDTNQIGFKPASKNDDYSYPLQEANGAYKATAIAFLKRSGIDYSNGSKNYPAKWNEELGILTVQL